MDPVRPGDYGRLLPADIARRMRTRINAGELSPGDRLDNERDLAASFGVARTTIREAIRILVENGYLVSKRGNGGGTFVSDLGEPQHAWLRQIREDPEWITDLIEYRKAIEVRAAALAAARRSADDLDAMRAAIEASTNPGSRGEFRQADHRFHVAVARASGSERLLQAVIRARGELFVPTDQLAFHDHFARTHDEHDRIRAAIEDGDATAASTATEEHLQSSLQDFLDAVLGADELGTD